MRPRESTTRLLERIREGDDAAYEKLFALLYGELKRVAGWERMDRNPGATLSTTALVHEAYVRLVAAAARPQDRAHFMAMAGKAMRHVIIDAARARAADKRGSGAESVPLSEADRRQADDEESRRMLDWIAFGAAIEELERVDPESCRVVELRYFAGRTVAETAEILGVSPSTVKRGWQSARAFLNQALEG